MERITRVRVTVLLTLFCLLIGFFGLRLYNLQVIETGGDTDNVKKFYTVTRVKAARGDILDCNGNVLVTNRATYDLVFNHFVILSNGNTNEHLLKLVNLCRELGATYNEHFPISKDAPFQYTLSELNAAGQGHFQAYLPVVAGGLDSDITAPVLMRTLREYYDIPADWSDADARAVIGLRYELRLRQDITNLPNYVFMEDVNNEILAAVLEMGIPGLNTEESMVRVYNTEYGAHILGYIGAITAKQWDEIYKHKEDYKKDALVGQSGFEEAFEEYLHGVDGYRVDVVTADGTLIKQYYQRDPDTGEEQRPIAGKNVELTIDLDLQTTAEEQLHALITDLRNTVDENPNDDEIPDGADAEGGSVVVMNVKTGQVLACASYPTYSLATFREDYQDLMQQPFAPLFNRALMATYAPGSTYKMCTLIAAMNGDPWIVYHTDYDGDGKTATGPAVKHVSVSRGLMIKNGEIWATEQISDENYLAKDDNAERGTGAANQPIFGVKKDGTAIIGSPYTAIEIQNTTQSKTLSAAGINRLPAPNSAILYNQRVGNESMAYEDAYEIYVECDSSAFGYGKTISGKVRRVEIRNKDLEKAKAALHDYLSKK